MIDLYDPAWEALDSAGHSAAKYLRRLMEGEGDFRENVDALAEELSHQLSFYNATAYALPHLAQLCRRLSVDEKAYLITQIGAAVAAEAYAPMPRDGEAWREFQEGLAPLAQEARDLAAHHADRVKALPRDLPQVFALSALALIWDRKHAFLLFLFAPWDEVPAMCPDCDWYEECMDLSEEPEYITPGELGEEGSWLEELLSSIGDRDLLPKLPYLYGTCTCPECGASGPVWEWIDRAQEEG